MPTANTASGPQIGNRLTDGPIPQKLLRFALPIILTNLVQQLYSLVDLMVIGQFVGTVGTVGVNNGSELSDLLTPFAVAFSGAGQIYIAQLFGAGDMKRVNRSVGTLLGFMFALSAFFAVLGICFCTPILRLINCPESALSQARAYMIITALGLPFIFGYNAIIAILRGIGESKRPLYFILVAATVNIVLDLLLVIAFRLEAAGTAIATVFSQIGAFAAAFAYLYRNRDKFEFRLNLSYFKIDPQILKIYLKLGLPQAFRVTLVRFTMIYINASANSYGLTVSATNAVGSKLQKFMELFTQGIDTASAAMIAQCLGAEKRDRAERTVWVALGMVSVCVVVMSALNLLAPRAVFGIFTHDEEVLSLGVVFLRIMCVHLVLSGLQAAFQSCVSGCGHASFNFVVGMLDGFVCKLSFVLLFTKVLGWGYLGLFWGNGLSRIVSLTCYLIYFLRGKWKYRTLLKDA